MQKTLTPNRRRADAATWITVAIIAAVYIAVFVLEQFLPPLPCFSRFSKRARPTPWWRFP